MIDDAHDLETSESRVASLRIATKLSKAGMLIHQQSHPTSLRMIEARAISGCLGQAIRARQTPRVDVVLRIFGMKREISARWRNRLSSFFSFSNIGRMKILAYLHDDAMLVPVYCC